MESEEPGEHRSGTVAIRLSDLVEAFEFVSVSDLDAHRAYICRKTGRFIFVSDIVDMEEEIPEDLDKPRLYQPVPNKRDLDLGKRVPLAFVAEHLPGSWDKAREMFNHNGAYRRFRTLLHQTGALETWYAFEQAAVEAALADWCDAVRWTVRRGRQTTP